MRYCLAETYGFTKDFLCSSLQEVMSIEEESTSCYCLMDSSSCHLLLDQPGSYALVGEPLTQAAVKRLKLAVFGSMEAGSMNYSLRVYCVDDTPHAFQVRGDTTCTQVAWLIPGRAFTNCRVSTTFILQQRPGHLVPCCITINSWLN